MSVHAAQVASTPADAAASAVVRNGCRRFAPDLFFASHFLPKPRREALYAVVAFCRMIAEAIDADDATITSARGLRDHPAVAPHVASTGALGQSCCSGNALDDRLAMFRDRLDEIYTGTLELPAVDGRSEAQHALHAVSRAIHRFEIPREYFIELAEGRAADLAISRIATWRALERHFDRTAGVAGRIMACVFGATHSDAARHAGRLAIAMRLTNVLRDVKADLAGGCIYLPQDDLARFRYSERELRAGVVNDAFRSLMQFEIDRVRDLYRTSAEGICWFASDGARLAAATIAVTHAGILARIERARFDVFERPVTRLTAGERLRRLPGALRLARRRDGQPVPEVF